MLRQILESIDTFAPDAVVFGLDDRTGSVRRDAYPDYKAGRAEKDPELVDQLDRAGALLDALGLATLTPAGLEADDVNASGATWARPTAGLRHHHLRPRRLRPHQPAHAGAAAHRRRHPRLAACSTRRGCSTCTACAPANYLAFAALRGDSSDNLPGVQGIGEKTAAILLDVAGSMDAAWADVDHHDGRALLAAIDDWAAETGVAASARPSYDACRPRVRASATTSTSR